MTNTTMPTPFSGKNYRRNSDDAGENACALCGKLVHNPTHMLRVVDGGARFASKDEAADEAGDMGYFTIGSDCLRRHPALQAITRPASDFGL